MRQRDERGSVTVWGVLIALIITLVIGITVDLTGQVNAQQRAHDWIDGPGRHLPVNRLIGALGVVKGAVMRSGMLDLVSGLA